jgi:ribonuclease P protein component
MNLRRQARNGSAVAQTLPPADRVRHRQEFLRAQSEGKRVHTPHFVLVAIATEGGRQRLGITVSRRVGDAVRRNRVKRVVREVFRRHRTLFPPACDVIVVARAGAAQLDYGRVLDEVVAAEAALRRAASVSRGAKR